MNIIKWALSKDITYAAILIGLAFVAMEKGWV